MKIKRDGYDMGEYSFRKPYQPGTLTDGNYIAVVAYAGGEGEDDMFCAFESMASGGVLECSHLFTRDPTHFHSKAIAIVPPSSFAL